MNTLTRDTNVPLQYSTVKGPTKNREKRMSSTSSKSAIESGTVQYSNYGRLKLNIIKKWEGQVKASLIKPLLEMNDSSLKVSPGES